MSARSTRRARAGRAAVMLISQANPGWDLSDPTRAPLRDPRTLAQTDGQPDGFQDFLLALREEVIAFRRPVAYVHGDSHYFRIDKPFLDRRAAGSRTSLAWKRSATTRRRQQRRAVGEGAGGLPRSAKSSPISADRSRQPDSGPCTLEGFPAPGQLAWTRGTSCRPRRQAQRRAALAQKRHHPTICS